MCEVVVGLYRRFKMDFVEGIDLENVHNNIINQGIEILSNPNLSDAAARSQASCSSIQEGQEPLTKKKTIIVSAKKN